ncbi:hypothetical protein [Acinetobacter brisouii]|uniref:hypothetical protein n=1 Tax=Acinetobacter brisouii TaxID=396323 RepID=UPI00124ECC71|nr:hypothetical protein [Acinetobacter brisouii]
MSEKHKSKLSTLFIDESDYIDPSIIEKIGKLDSADKNGYAEFFYDQMRNTGYSSKYYTRPFEQDRGVIARISTNSTSKEQVAVFSFLNGDPMRYSHVISDLDAYGAAIPVDDMVKNKMRDTLCENGLPNRCLSCSALKNEFEVREVVTHKNPFGEKQMTCSTRCAAGGCDDSRDDFVEVTQRERQRSGRAIKVTKINGSSYSVSVTNAYGLSDGMMTTRPHVFAKFVLEDSNFVQLSMPQANKQSQEELNNFIEQRAEAELIPTYDVQQW